MPRHAETRHLPYTPEQMYDLVADVPRYSEFLPWVVAVRVRSDGDEEMIADLVVGFKALRENFTSRVHKHRPESIRVDYLDGPLKHLRNEWRFHPDGAGGVFVDFTVDFEFKSRLFEALAGQYFDKALRKMTTAFVDRAGALYGTGGESAGASGISRSSAHKAA